MATFFSVLDKSFTDCTFVNLAIFAILLGQCKCQAPSLTGPTSGVLGSSVHLICTLTGSTAIDGGLLFNRNGVIGSQCLLNVPKCSLSSAKNGTSYSCGCVSGQMREFYLNISSLSLQDDNTWTCKYSNVESNNISLSVYYAPNISFSFNNKDVTENSILNIDCSSGLTAGNPSENSYIWTGPGGYSKSGSILDRRVSRSQGGSYTCTAGNSAGLSDSAQVNITVLYAPEISSSFPNNKNVTENSLPNIDCSSGLTAGNPSDTSYTWTGPGDYNKSGSVLDRRVSRSEGGTYTCTARNSEGLSDSAQVNVNVQYAPEISSSFPNNKDVTERVSSNINCSSGIKAGNPSDISYTWTGPGGYSKSGSVLDRRVSKSQGGSYTCTARNSAGLSDSAQVNINVQYAPEISPSFPNNKNVTENLSPNIACSSGLTAGNPSDTSYTWTGPEGYNKSGSVLDRIVSRSQGGSYTCTARNSAGLSDSAQVNINVQYAPEISSSFPNNKDVTENTSINIDCSSGLTAGNPSDTSYTWTGPGGYNKSGSLLDRRAIRSQGGFYNCTARNSAGLLHSAQVDVNVQYIDTPVLTIDPPEVMESASVHLECRVSSNPTVEMTISNLDNNTEIVEGEVTNTRQLNIDRAQCLHNGTFQCVTNNRALSRSKTVTKQLNVLCLPRYDVRRVHLTTVAAAFNKPVQLVAEVIANPSPNFTWGRLEEEDLVTIRKSTVSMVNSSKLKSVLQINVTSSKDYGQYAVKVQNTVGETLLKYQLYANKDPDGETLNVAAVAGGIAAAILVIIIVAGFFILYKRGTSRHFCWSEGKRNEDMSPGRRIRKDLVTGERAASGKVGGDRRGPSGGATEVVSDVYSVVSKKPKPTKAVADVYAQVKPKKTAKKGDIYKNTCQGQFLADADAKTFANSGFVGDTRDETGSVQNPQPQTGRDADGCMYVGIDFSNLKPGKVIIGREKGSYVDIAHGKVGPPPPPDEYEDEEE